MMYTTGGATGINMIKLKYEHTRTDDQFDIKKKKLSSRIQCTHPHKLKGSNPVLGLIISPGDIRTGHNELP